MTNQTHYKSKYQQQHLQNLHQRSSTPEIFQIQSPVAPPRSSTPQFEYYNQPEPQRSMIQRPNYFNNAYRDMTNRGLKPQSITPPEQRAPPLVETRRPMTPNNDANWLRYKHPSEINCYPKYQMSQLARKESFQRNTPARELQDVRERVRDKELELLREIKALKKDSENLRRENSQLKREKENSNEERNQIYFEKYQAMNLLDQESRENEKLKIELERKNTENLSLKDELNELRGQHLVSRKAIFETGYTRSIEDKYFIAPIREQFEVLPQNVSAIKGQYAYASVEEMKRKMSEMEHQFELMRIAYERKEKLTYTQPNADLMKFLKQQVNY